jgi:hypothetical protein
MRRKGSFDWFLRLGMMFPFVVFLARNRASDENRPQTAGAWGKRKTRKIVCLFCLQKSNDLFRAFSA